MNFSISKRNFIRIISFILAAILSLSIYSFSTNSSAIQTQQKLEYHYLKNISSLSDYMQNIENALVKVMYSNSPSTINELTSTLWREASFAKDAMASLPLNALNLENTYKFLSQVGDYSMSLSKKVATGESISEEERKNLDALREYSDKFLEEILLLQDGVNSGAISLSTVTNEIKKEEDEIKDNNNLGVSDGFSEFESGFSSYPSLIYDGPFSDHIMQKEPEMLKTLPEISKENAKAVASKATGVSLDELKNDTDEEGKMPSYTFATDDTNVAVTKNGGLLSYVIKYREVGDRTVSVEECIPLAKQYLSNMGIDSITDSYYEISNNLITINFAYEQDDVICYTDLIKVSVAMDNGEILRYDGRGYITNHQIRENISPSISSDVAQSKLSPILSVRSSRLALIPTPNLDQVLCYEFDCTSSKDENILVYVNAKTGKEEQLLILYIDENGTLTK